jgi:phage shock protein PspC (stress-responsive transcriptional regulator)
MDEIERSNVPPGEGGGRSSPPDPPTAPTEEYHGGTEGEPKRLERSRGDRVLAGVAGGLGRYFSVDPLIFRIGFAVSVFFGGLGALAYIALALFVPNEPGPDGETERPPIQRSRWLAVAAGVIVVCVAISAAGSLFFWGDWGWDGGPWGLLILAAIAAGAYALIRRHDPEEPMTAGRKVAAVALAVVAAFALIGVALASAFATATGNGTVIAALVIAVGAMLVVAAFRGGARWLIAPALALAVPLGVVSAADVSFAGGIGDRYHQPSSVREIGDRYELGVGRLVVDLRELDWARDTELALELDLGVGEAVLVVPEDVCVSPDLHVGAGEIVLGSGVDEGVDVDSNSRAGIVRGASVDLDGEVDVGSLKVLNDVDRFYDGHGDFGSESQDRATVC